MNPNNQFFESYVPVYDTVPERWDDARQFLIEHLKRISNAVNLREIGWFLDEELISGKQFIPGSTDPVTMPNANNSQLFRTVLRKVIDVSPLIAGVNAPIAHGITFNSNFTLIDLWVSGTNSGTLQAIRITGNDVVMDSTNLNITSPLAFDRAWAVVEYIQEL